MDETVRERILVMLAEFYKAHARSFSKSREGHWHSWLRLWTEMERALQPSTVLDLGCGNGRFASFLKSINATARYVGVDSETQFIEIARERHPSLQFYVDTIDHALLAAASHTYDAIVCFGVFHHLPGFDYRIRVLHELARVISTRGLIAISLWQPKRLSNFDNKVIKRHVVEGMEENDFFFGWKGDFSQLRYCHHFDDHEIELLVSAAELRLVTQFQGEDGGNDFTNRYLLLQKR